MDRQTKLLREAMRIVLGTGDRVSDLYEPFVQHRYDRAIDHNLRVASGGQPGGARVAILVLYQPNGVSASTRVTLAHLIAQGYAPWVVANGGVLATDVSDLLPLTSRLIQRPNYGHDFGGYRDAIGLMERLDFQPEELLLLNDSIWFPIWTSTSLISDLQQPDADLGGPMFEYKDGRRHAGHFESYMLRVGPNLLRKKDFWQFWQRYPVSGNRRKVLSRGEKGFSSAMLGAGARARPIASRQLFVERMADQKDAFVAKTLLYAGYADPDDATAALAVGSPGSTGYRDRALEHIRKVAARTSVQESFVYAAMKLFGLPFLKKRLVPGTLAMRRRFCEAVLAGDLPQPDPVIWGEIVERTPNLLNSP